MLFNVKSWVSRVLEHWNPSRSYCSDLRQYPEEGLVWIAVWNRGTGVSPTGGSAKCKWFSWQFAYFLCDCSWKHLSCLLKRWLCRLSQAHRSYNGCQTIRLFIRLFTVHTRKGSGGNVVKSKTLKKFAFPRQTGVSNIMTHSRRGRCSIWHCCYRVCHMCWFQEG